jgi:hypothetical protein
MFKRDTLIVLAQLIVILILALWFSTTGFAPIYNNVIEPEGFHQMNTPLEYTGVSQPTSAKDDLHALNTINPDNSECKKVGGFDGFGVFCTPSGKPESIDIYSQAKGDINCNGLGYFNSKGPLCLTDDMKRMLSTRGANANGGNGQIGSA